MVHEVVRVKLLVYSQNNGFWCENKAMLISLLMGSSRSNFIASSSLLNVEMLT